jgi:hypothetical protein
MGDGQGDGGGGQGGRVVQLEGVGEASRAWRDAACALRAGPGSPHRAACFRLEGVQLYACLLKQGLNGSVYAAGSEVVYTLGFDGRLKLHLDMPRLTELLCRFLADGC